MYMTDPCNPYLHYLERLLVLLADHDLVRALLAGRCVQGRLQPGREELEPGALGGGMVACSKHSSQSVIAEPWQGRYGRWLTDDGVCALGLGGEDVVVAHLAGEVQVGLGAGHDALAAAGADRNRLDRVRSIR
jgi:hypothetical protein